jgi:serine/threonine protein kinase
MDTRDPELIFDILKHLDSGGQADVVLLRLRATGGIFAGKFLREAWDPHARAAFRKEAERQARVAGDHVVPIVTWNFDVEKPFVVMQYMPGGSLAKEIERRGGLSVSEAIDTTHKIAIALADLHARNVIHRDLKPGNVLVDSDGRLRLSDLGIAATMTLNEFVRAQGFVGTAGYAAPEQYVGVARPQSDVFALGKILRELVLSRANGALLGLGQEALLLANRLSMNEWRSRPTAREAVALLAQLLRKQPVVSPSSFSMFTNTALPLASPKPQPSSSSRGLGSLIYGGLAVAGLAALFSGGGSTWDPVAGRYRGADGRFTLG